MDYIYPTRRQCRSNPKNDARHHRSGQRNTDYSPANRDLTELWQRVRNKSEEQVFGDDKNRQAKRSSNGCKQYAFGQRLTGQSALAGADGTTDCHLAETGATAREPKIGNVHAAYDQN